MSGITDIHQLHAALKDAEDELCNIGAILTNEGWNTATISMTIDVIRIALHGTDGRGNGIERFQDARNDLALLRKEEAAISDLL